MVTGFKVLLEYFSHIGFQSKSLLSDCLRDVNLIKQFIFNNLRHQSMDSFYGSFTAAKKKTHHIMSQELKTCENARTPVSILVPPIMIFISIHTPQITTIYSLLFWFLAFCISFNHFIYSWPLNNVGGKGTNSSAQLKIHI